MSKTVSSTASWLHPPSQMYLVDSPVRTHRRMALVDLQDGHRAVMASPLKAGSQPTLLEVFQAFAQDVGAYAHRSTSLTISSTMAVLHRRRGGMNESLPCLSQRPMAWVRVFRISASSSEATPYRTTVFIGYPPTSLGQAAALLGVEPGQDLGGEEDKPPSVVATVGITVCSTGHLQDGRGGAVQQIGTPPPHRGRDYRLKSAAGVVMVFPLSVTTNVVNLTSEAFDSLCEPKGVDAAPPPHSPPGTCGVLGRPRIQRQPFPPERTGWGVNLWSASHEAA